MHTYTCFLALFSKFAFVRICTSGRRKGCEKRGTKHMVCLLFPVQTVKAFLPDMMKRNSGHIVSIASSAGLFGVAGLADYCASKFAAVGFMESIRAELAAMGLTGIHTTVVCPYFINTGMFDRVRSK